MGFEKRLVIEFAGLTIQFDFPTAILIPKGFKEFQKELVQSEYIDVHYDVRLIEEPLALPKYPNATYAGIDIYQFSDSQLRVYSQLNKKNGGCQIAVKSNNNGKNILYYPASKWEYYSQELHFLHLIGIEEVLIRNQALLLHSSLVELDGYTVLFSGPSGVGKSTQASLWKEYLEAEILNGDRCIIRKINDKFYGCGSPWAGTSGIYRRELAPIKGIYILKQGEENKIRRLKAEAFIKIYQQCIVNAWDNDFIKNLSDLILELLHQIPVYELTCRPDEEAVKLAYNTLFKGGV